MQLTIDQGPEFGQKPALHISIKYTNKKTTKKLTNGTHGGSNTTLFIGSISYMLRRQVFLVQQSLVGSLLANMLLLPATAMFYAAYRRRPTTFSRGATRINILLLLLSVSAFVIPTVFDAQTNLSVEATAQMSQGASVLLLVAYGAYLGFQLCSHRDLFDVARIGRDASRMEEGSSSGVGPDPAARTACKCVAGRGSLPSDKTITATCTTTRITGIGGWAAVFVGSTAVLYFTIDNLAAGVQSFAQADGFASISGLILVPVLNCDLAAIDRTRDSMDSVITSTIGKSMQSALLIAPLLVIVGWGVGADDMNLSFDVFQITCLFLTIFLLGCLTTTLRFHAW